MLKIDRMLDNLHNAIEQAQIRSAERRIKTLVLASKDTGYTIFEVALKTDVRFRETNEAAINQALTQGWKVRVQTGAEVIILDPNEIEKVVLLYENNRTSKVLITMRPNLERVQAGTHIDSFVQDPRDVNLVRE